MAMRKQVGCLAMAPLLIVPVGPPACGKSSLADDLLYRDFPRHGVVCPDTYREVLTGDRTNQAENEEVFSVCHTVTQSRLRHGQHVYFDATNLRSQDLLRFKEWAVKFGAHLVLVTFPWSEEVLVRRNAKREHPVPSEVLERMVQQYVLLEEEGFLGQAISYRQAMTLWRTR